MAQIFFIGIFSPLAWCDLVNFRDYTEAVDELDLSDKENSGTDRGHPVRLSAKRERLSR
jgi:hypothetical protein